SRWSRRPGASSGFPAWHARPSRPSARRPGSSCAASSSALAGPARLGKGPCVSPGKTTWDVTRRFAAVSFSTLSRNLGLWLLLLLMGLILWSIVSKQQPRAPEISFTRFMQAVDEGRVAEVLIQGQSIRGRYKAERGEGGDGFKTFAPQDPDLVPLLRERALHTQAP